MHGKNCTQESSLVYIYADVPNAASCTHTRGCPECIISNKSPFALFARALNECSSHSPLRALGTRCAMGSPMDAVGPRLHAKPMSLMSGGDFPRRTSDHGVRVCL